MAEPKVRLYVFFLPETVYIKWEHNEDLVSVPPLVGVYAKSYDNLISVYIDEE
jgi:hypothetical protein